MNIHPLWFLCITIRLLYSQYIFESIWIRLILLIIGIGFFYKYVTGSNMEYQISKVFWHETRIIHSIVYISAFVIKDIKIVKMLLFSDVIFSILYRLYTGY